MHCHECHHIKAADKGAWSTFGDPTVTQTTGARLFFMDILNLSALSAEGLRHTIGTHTYGTFPDTQK